MKKILPIIILSLFVLSCATISSLPQTAIEYKKQKLEEGNYTNTRIYLYPYSHVFESAKTVLRAWGFIIKKADIDQNVILASGQIQVNSSGAILGLYFTEISNSKTLIQTIEKRKVSTHLATKWHSSIILDGIKKELSLKSTKFIRNLEY